MSKLFQRSSAKKIAFIAALVILATTFENAFACSLSVSKSSIELDDFNTFSNTAQRYHKTVSIGLDGNCSGDLVYSFEKPVGISDDTDPRVYISSGNKDLYNTTAGKRGFHRVPVIKGDSEAVLLLTLLAESNSVVESGLISHPVLLSLDVVDAEAQSVLGNGSQQKSLDIDVVVARHINARFVGTSVNGLAQSMRLSLGNLNGNPSGNVNFSVQSNVKYEVRVSSENKGRLIIDDEGNRWNNELPYILDIDGKTMDLVGGGDTLENQGFSEDKNGKTHRLGVYVMGDTKKVRAGTYKDLLTIEVGASL